MFPAYIDPGSGSLIIQVLIAGVVSLPILLRRQIGNFLSLFRRGSAGNPADGD